MKKYLLILGLLAMQAFAGNEKGNGGFIQDLISAELNSREVLTEKDIEKIVEKRGYEIRKNLIVPLFQYFLKQKNIDLPDDLYRLKKLLSKDESELLLDVEITQLKLGFCDGPSTCTGSSKYDDIILDTKALMQTSYGTSFSELAGLIAHEFLHHFFKEIPKHDQYILARFMKESVLKKTYKVRTFKFDELLIKVDENGKEKYAIMNDDHYSRHNFCLMKGYLKVLGKYARGMNDLTVADSKLNVNEDMSVFYMYDLISQANGDFGKKISTKRVNNFLPGLSSVTTQITCAN